MKRGGNGDTHRLNFVEQVSVMLERMGSILSRNCSGTGRIDIHHTDQFHLFDFSIFLGMELAKVTDTDDTDLDFFHLPADPPLRTLDELEEMLDLWGPGDVILSYLLHRFLQCQTGAKNDAVSLLQGLQCAF